MKRIVLIAAALLMVQCQTTWFHPDAEVCGVLVQWNAQPPVAEEMCRTIRHAEYNLGRKFLPGARAFFVADATKKCGYQDTGIKLVGCWDVGSDMAFLQYGFPQAIAHELLHRDQCFENDYCPIDYDHSDPDWALLYN